MKKDKPIIVGISGSTGIPYSIKLLHYLLTSGFTIHLVSSSNGIKVINHELNLDIKDEPESIKEELLSFIGLSEYNAQLKVFSSTNLFASISSGSYETQGMIILPCSMNTLAAINSGISSSLLTRAADVCLKQNRKLVLAPREMPFSPIHLKNMYDLSLMSVKIVVPSPAFYNNPKNVDDMISYVVGKVLDVFEVNHDLYKRWE